MRADVLGSWSLEHSEWHDENGPVEPEGGHFDTALLMYGASGTVSVQMMRPHKASFTSDDWRDATPDEKARAWGDYFCYFGTFEVDESRRVITHSIEGSWFPNLIGTQQVRRYELVDDLLTLTAETAWGHVAVSWRRIPTAS